MATMAFCGHTGKMFRGRVTPESQWKNCDAVERPSGSGLPITEDLKSCLMAGHVRCPLYCEGYRTTNREPYRWSVLTQYGRSDKRIVVAGGNLDKQHLKSNRKECGKIIRCNIQKPEL